MEALNIKQLKYKACYAIHNQISRCTLLAYLSIGLIFALSMCNIMTVANKQI